MQNRPNKTLSPQTQICRAVNRSSIKSNPEESFGFVFKTYSCHCRLGLPLAFKWLAYECILSFNHLTCEQVALWHMKYQFKTLGKIAFSRITNLSQM